MEVNNEIKKYEETVKRLYKLLKRVCQERDEARDQLQLLARNYQPSTESSTIPQADHSMNIQYNSKVKSTEVSDMSSMAFSNCYDLSLSNEKHFLAESSNYLALPKQPNHQNYQNGTIKADHRVASRDNKVDGASHVIDKLAGGKPLPQKGRLLQTVTKAGPLLHTLLVAPLPQWKNPPPPSTSSDLQLSRFQNNDSLSTDTDNKASVDPNYGFVPTSLTLAFPGNYHGGSGLSVKNERISYAALDSNVVHNNHTIAVKKRKFL